MFSGVILFFCCRSSPLNGDHARAQQSLHKPIQNTSNEPLSFSRRLGTRDLERARAAILSVQDYLHVFSSFPIITLKLRDESKLIGVSPISVTCSALCIRASAILWLFTAIVDSTCVVRREKALSGIPKWQDLKQEITCPMLGGASPR
jgi:hypothetical protein